MKRYGNLYDKLCDIENIKLAHKNARKKKTHYKEVKEVDKDVDYYCNEIRDMLISKSFKNSPYEIFIKNDKGKRREIYKLPYYPDRIIHHAIVQVVEPIWKKTLITDTYQSIKGNYCIRPIDEGLDFLGVVIYSKYSLIRKKIKYNCVFKVKNGCSRGVIASYNGWLLMCDSYNLRKKYNI